MTCGRFVSLIGLAMACAAGATAQPTGALAGHVMDPSQAGVSGASITIVNEDNGFRRAAESQVDGSYAVGSLAAGSYKITVRKDGFRTMIRFHVPVDRGRTAHADFALSLGSVLETVTVEGAAPLFDREDASVATFLEREVIEKLPLNGQGVLGLLELSPGTDLVPATRGDAGQFVAGGQRPNTNYFTLDGISANNGVAAGGLPAQTTGGSLPVMSAFGSLDAMISLDAVEDFRIQTSSSTSQFGRLPGASISITSRSGSNEFHGSASYDFRHELLAANDWFANRAGEPRTALREENAGVTFGGPLWRNRTFFFSSYEHLELEQPFAWFEPVPSVHQRSIAAPWVQSILNLFPDPNGPLLGKGLAIWNGRNSRPATLDAGAIRLDQVLSSRATFFARFSDSPSSNEFGSTQVNRLDFQSWSGTAGLTLHAAPGMVIDLRANESATFAQSAWNGNGDCQLLPLVQQFLPTTPTCDLLVRFQISGVGQFVTGREGDRQQRQRQFIGDAGWKHGAHSLKFGADFLRILPVRRDHYGTLSLIADSLPALDNTSTYWIARSAPQSDATEVREFSVWAHDSWQIGPHLVLNGGLRWEYSPAPPIQGDLNFYRPDTNTIEMQDRPLWWRPYGHFAPRAGIVFSPGKSGRTVLRAGGGLYFDSSLSIATDAINSGPLSADFYSGSRFAPFPSYLSFGFMPNLVLPRVFQWNFSAERALTAQDVISVGYVGSSGGELIRREAGGPGNLPSYWIALTTNNGYSNYHALIAQYQRRLARGLEALVSYAWSHSIDNDSSDTFLLYAGAGSAASRDRGSSDFDLRHSITASFSYALPSKAKGWFLDGIFHAHTGFPITVLDADQYTGIFFMNAFRPNLAPNTPTWIDDPNAPGGQRINSQAFQAASGQQGTLGRNVLSGFGMAQFDMAVRREFRVAERRTLEVRVEGFNALNHANFADPVRYLDSPLFGQSTASLNMMLGTGSPGSGLAPLLETGGARSVEAVVRLRF